MLEVQNKNNLLVVDSRLVAEELGIQHTTFKDTISKYTEKLESLTDYSLEPVPEASGNRLFKEYTPKQSNGSGGVTYYLLTEEQATFLMTLSQNTPQVVEAKFKLVQAFSKAKQALSTINPELLTYMNELSKQMNILAARTQRLDAIDKATETKKGIRGVIDTEIEDSYPNDLSYTVREYLVMKKQSLEHLNTMRKRAIGFWKQSCQVTELPKKGNEVLFVGNDISYLDQALKTVLGLD